MGSEKKDYGKSIEEDSDDDMFIYTTSSSDDDDSADEDGLSLSDLDDEIKIDTSPNHQGSYRVMSEADIRQCQENDITNISAVLSISRAEASLLLIHCNWNVNEVTDKWFADEQRFREEVGLAEIPIFEFIAGRDVTCGICSGVFPRELVTAAFCGHLFCNTCWAAYIRRALLDGLRCLRLRCPNPSCSAAVGQDMINMLASTEDKEKYAHYYLKSYMEYNKKAKRCPSPGCNHTVVLLDNSCASKVTCNCFYSFCWKCAKEAHQPVSCAAAANWEMEGIVQSENWTIANTRQCPKCKRSVEIRGRCKRMECAECDFHFCRLCLGSWMEHGHWEGDLYIHICSEQKLLEVENGEEEIRAKVAQDSMTKYHNYFTQWKTHDMDQQEALKGTNKTRNENVEKLAHTQRLTQVEVSFVTEAWVQIAECKRALKWACVSNYYLLPSESDKKTLIEYLQRQAQVVLERLYQCAQEIKMFLDKDEPSEQFIQFRDRLCLETRVAQNYFQNFVWALENGVPDLNTLRRMISSVRFRAIAQAGTSGSRAFVDETGHWCCSHCQFPNDISATICVMCYH